MSNELLPCPFCGELPRMKAEESYNEVTERVTGMYEVHCACGANTGLTSFSRERAVQNWNTRTANASEASAPHGACAHPNACARHGCSGKCAAPPSDRAAVEVVTEAMVDAALRATFADPDYRPDQEDKVLMRSALEAAERARASSPNAAAAVGQEVELHPRTRDLVSRFSVALAGKLAAAERKYGYTDGWADDDWMEECRGKLIEHVAKGDPIDVAAYCAFLWHHGEYTELRLPWPRPPHMRIR